MSFGNYPIKANHCCPAATDLFAIGARPALRRSSDPAQAQANMMSTEEQRTREASNAAASKGRLVLLIDDNDDHAELVRRALHLSGRPHELVRLDDGEQALDFLRGARRSECALILLDLRLPRIGGLEVLRFLRQAEETLTAPVVVLTTSDAYSDIAAAYEHGAHAYVVKPSDFTSFGELARELAHFWLGWNKLPTEHT